MNFVNSVPWSVIFVVNRVRFKSSETLISKTIFVETSEVSIIKVSNLAVP